jgi:NADP-dependent 3-hydroxy acid dehydrogenase YdfG
MRQFTGRVAVVTGAASGIGRALAGRFAAEGMRCVLADVDDGALDRAVGELRRDGAAAIGVRTDVASAADVEALADRTVSEFGAVHLVCNNAGVGVGSDFAKIPLDVWDWVLGVDLWGVIHGCRTFLPLLLEQDEAHIVNTSSMAALNGHPDPHLRKRPQPADGSYRAAAEQLRRDVQGRARRRPRSRARSGQGRGRGPRRGPRSALLCPPAPGGGFRHGRAAASLDADRRAAAAWAGCRPQRGRVTHPIRFPTSAVVIYVNRGLAAH